MYRVVGEILGRIKIRKKENKNYARTLYRHECEPVVQMLNTAGRVVAWGVIPLLRGGLY
jgi:hypothetical protein